MRQTQSHTMKKAIATLTGASIITASIMVGSPTKSLAQASVSRTVLLEQVGLFDIVKETVDSFLKKLEKKLAKAIRKKKTAKIEQLRTKIAEYKKSKQPKPVTQAPEPLTILGTGVVLASIPLLRKEYVRRREETH